MTPCDEIEVPMLGGLIGFAVLTIWYYVSGRRITDSLDNAAERLQTGSFWTKLRRLGVEC
jgi:hypothetical protein